MPEDVDGQVSLRRVRALILVRRGEVEEAERVLREAIARAERSDSLELLADCRVALADVLQRAGRAEEARVSLDEAVTLLERKGNLARVSQLRGAPVESLIEPDRSR